MFSLKALVQRFSTGVPQEFLKHAVPDYLARGTNLFSLRLSKEKTAAANTIAIQYERIKSIIFFCQIGKNIFFDVPQDLTN